MEPSFNRRKFRSIISKTLHLASHYRKPTVACQARRGAISSTDATLLKRGTNATMLPMPDRHRTRFPRCVGAVVVFVFAIACVTSSICPGCLSEDLLSAQKTVPQNVDHHPSTHACDRDSCSCCGFQFLAASRQSIREGREFTPAVVQWIAPIPNDYPSDFYHPPRP
jgi:hypothetical protein